MDKLDIGIILGIGIIIGILIPVAIHNDKDLIDKSVIGMTFVNIDVLNCDNTLSDPNYLCYVPVNEMEDYMSNKSLEGKQIAGVKFGNNFLVWKLSEFNNNKFQWVEIAIE